MSDSNNSPTEIINLNINKTDINHLKNVNITNEAENYNFDIGYKSFHNKIYFDDIQINRNGEIKNANNRGAWKPPFVKLKFKGLLPSDIENIKFEIYPYQQDGKPVAQFFYVKNIILDSTKYKYYFEIGEFNLQMGTQEVIVTETDPNSKVTIGSPSITKGTDFHPKVEIDTSCFEAEINSDNKYYCPETNCKRVEVTSENPLRNGVIDHSYVCKNKFKDYCQQIKPEKKGGNRKSRRNKKRKNKSKKQKKQKRKL